MLINESPSAFIEYFADCNGVLIKWKKLKDLRSFKVVYNKVLERAVKKYKIKYYCTDLRAVGPLSREQEAWLVSEYYHAVYRELKDKIALAVVFSEEHFNAIVHNYQLPAVNKQPDFIQFNYFTDLREALDWLRAMQKGQDQTILMSAS